MEVSTQVKHKNRFELQMYTFKNNGKLINPCLTKVLTQINLWISLWRAINELEYQVSVSVQGFN